MIIEALFDKKVCFYGKFELFFWVWEVNLKPQKYTLFHPLFSLKLQLSHHNCNILAGALDVEVKNFSQALEDYEKVKFFDKFRFN